jgi:hypothetical protein
VWRCYLFSGAVEATEVPWEEGARLINECTYLYAREIREIEELTLGLTIVEAKAQAPVSAAEETGPLAFLKIGGRPIEEDETCRLFQLLFDRNHMISYTVLNESYGKYPQPPEEFTGKLFRVFSRSHLLEFTERTTCHRGHFRLLSCLCRPAFVPPPRGKPATIPGIPAKGAKMDAGCANCERPLAFSPSCASLYC